MADEYNRRCVGGGVGGGGGGSNCNWWDPSPTTTTTRRTPTFSSSIVDSTATTSSSVDTFPDHHSLHMMGLGLSSHQPILHHYPPLLHTDVEPTPEFNTIKGSSPSMFSHSSSSVDSSSHGLPSPTFLAPLESSGVYQGHLMPASSPNDHNNSGYGYHQPATGGGMPMSNYNSDDVMMGMNWMTTMTSNKDQFPQFLKSSSMVDVVPKPIQPQLMNINGQYGSFWNGAVGPMADPRPAVFFPVAPPQMSMPSFGDKRKNDVMEVRSTSGAGRRSNSGSGRTSTASTTTTGGATPKRPRNEASSTALPPFKVRKEKMGDRITALQQLVSPFGKTDTASVLSEAIEYIKFLHEQVNGLTSPYLKSGASLQQQQQRSQDLRSRGLCLVPVSSTFPVAHETTMDFWTPTFGPAGAFR